MKAEIYNLIILDESGSMSMVKDQTISGCNETIQTIKAAQKRNSETQDHRISIYAFQDGSTPSRYIIKNVPAAAAVEVTDKDYEPCGCTPLYDAVGSTLTDLRATIKNHDMAVGSVTIITDGMENSSTQYTGEQIRKMISALKEEGWNFNFIGANIDVEAVSRKLNIDNAMAFKSTQTGTREMFAVEKECREAYYDRMAMACEDMDGCAEMPAPERMMRMREGMKKASRNYFNKDKK